MAERLARLRIHFHRHVAMDKGADLLQLRHPLEDGKNDLLLAKDYKSYVGPAGRNLEESSERDLGSVVATHCVNRNAYHAKLASIILLAALKTLRK
ncbi:hypothetical protein GCM10023174_31170 [Chelativorans composti]